jgi:uncharacterized caspase-like protein
MPVKKRARGRTGQRALVVGISDYLPPFGKLQAVAADVREMAKLLESESGVFRSGSIGLLTDKRATRPRILDDLQDTLAGAGPDETVFVYIAGHGAVQGDRYYFIAHDTVDHDLSSTGVPLTDIRRLFDATRSRRVFLWLDFCHSGGMLARGSTDDDLSVIRRELAVVQGHGKVIVAACTAGQFAYECPTIGHGLFTDALLRGLKCEAASAQGEVTASSLFDFIDHQIGSARQRPMLFGEMTGRLVLMHYQRRKAKASSKPLPAKPSISKAKAARPRPKKSETWVMLGDSFFLADHVHHSSGGKMEVAIRPTSGEDEAALASSRPDRFGGRTSMPFAAGNEAHLVRIDEVETRTTGGIQVWTLHLTAEERAFGTGLVESSVNGISADEIAELRAGRILLNNPPPPSGSRRDYGSESFVEGFIASQGRYPAECVVRSIFKQSGAKSNWKECAKLKAVFLLKATGTVEHVLELTLGSMRKGQIAVTFRGRRQKQYSNAEPAVIEVRGNCPLG